MTTVQGLPKKFDQKKILKVIKKKFACNGTIVNDTEMGEVIQLQGDQRKDVQEFLVDKKEGLGLDSKTIKVFDVAARSLTLRMLTTLAGSWFLNHESTSSTHNHRVSCKALSLLVLKLDDPSLWVDGGCLASSLQALGEQLGSGVECGASHKANPRERANDALHERSFKHSLCD